MRFLFRTLSFLVPPTLPIPLFALPCSLVADALLGMLNIDLLPLLNCRNCQRILTFSDSQEEVMQNVDCIALPSLQTKQVTTEIFVGI
jgi:hypothetical protein